MLYYFCADKTSALKIDGEFLGIISPTPACFPKTKMDSFIEFCPLDGQNSPVCFVLNEQFLQTPPENLTVVTSLNAVIVYFRLPNLINHLGVINQRNFNRASVTVYTDNGYKLSLQTPNDFYCEQLDFKVDSCEFTPIFNDNLLLITYNQSPVFYGVYKLEGSITKLLGGNAERITTNPFRVQQNFFDIANHQVTTEYEYFGGELKTKNKTVCVKDEFNVDQLPQEILPFAFAEELLVGGNVDKFLADNVIKNKDKLNGYLGNFIGTCPLPPFADGVGLIYKKNKNLYSIKRLSITFLDRKITNLTLE